MAGPFGRATDNEGVPPSLVIGLGGSRLLHSSLARGGARVRVLAALNADRTAHHHSQQQAVRLLGWGRRLFSSRPPERSFWRHVSPQHQPAPWIGWGNLIVVRHGSGLFNTRGYRIAQRGEPFRFLGEFMRWLPQCRHAFRAFRREVDSVNAREQGEMSALPRAHSGLGSCRARVAFTCCVCARQVAVVATRVRPSLGGLRAVAVGFPDGSAAGLERSVRKVAASLVGKQLPGCVRRRMDLHVQHACAHMHTSVHLCSHACTYGRLRP